MAMPVVSYSLLQDTPAGSLAGAGFGMGLWIFILVMIVVQIAAMWKVFEKAGRPGWAAIIPIYNVYILLKVAGKPGWWLILMLIPLVNIIVAIIVSVSVAENFGRGALFGIGLAILGFIFYPVLGFGDAQYQASSS